jgi:predicted enzyme related to lactoylglutathione lyase
MTPGAPNPVVHLELRTCNLPRACAFYTRLFGWRAETLQTVSGDYLTIEFGGRIEGGVVEHDTERPCRLAKRARGAGRRRVRPLAAEDMNSRRAFAR